MGIASRIRELRANIGKSDVEMAQLLGMNIHSYGDLEQHDDELVSTLTLDQALRLASILGVALCDLFPVEAEPEVSVSLEQLPQLIESWIKREGISVEEAEDRIGWSLGELLKAPRDEGLRRPLMFYHDLAASVGVDWVSLVPSNAPGTAK
jgi:transcriptional regulator with XRE-family HTH domain